MLLHCAPIHILLTLIPFERIEGYFPLLKKTTIVNSNNREKIPLNKEHLFVYNKEQTFFIEELFQWMMGSCQTESLFA
jgi:hypothetical protein